MNGAVVIIGTLVILKQILSSQRNVCHARVRGCSDRNLAGKDTNLKFDRNRYFAFCVKLIESWKNQTNPGPFLAPTRGVWS